MSEMSSGPDLLNELAHEFAERYRRGERPSPTEYADRHPELASQIRELFPAVVELERGGAAKGPPGGPNLPPDSKGGAPPRQLGDYRILREIGRGGMGIVYEAEQESLGRHVALKVLPAHAALNATHLERFRREARAVARLHHTNIVPVFGVGEADGVHFYAMQFIQGQGLDKVLEEVKRLRGRQGPATEAAGGGNESIISIAQGLLSGQFENNMSLAPGDHSGPVAVKVCPATPPAACPAPGECNGPSSMVSGGRAELASRTETQYFRGVAQAGLKVADALDYAHRQGILHRDIKPSNLLLDIRGTVWITDFGLAKAEDSDELTGPGDIVGTLRYMAPERFQGQADPRSDIYSLSVTLYELLTLRPAFQDSNRNGLIERVRNETPPRPRKVNRGIPRDLETVVLKAMAKRPADRYPTAQDLADDLQRFLEGRPIKARRTSVVEHAWRWCRRNPGVSSLTGAVALLVLLIAIGASLAAVLLKDKADRLEVSEDQKNKNLCEAYLAEARARRVNPVAGRRFDSLAALDKARKLLPLLKLDLATRVKYELELRNETIACMVLADLGKGEPWEGHPPGSTCLAFDPALTHYARGDEQGNISIRTVAGDQEVKRLPGAGHAAEGVYFSPDGHYLAALNRGGPAATHPVWDWQRREIVLQLPPQLIGLSFSAVWRRIAMGRPGGSIAVYDVALGKSES